VFFITEEQGALTKLGAKDWHSLSAMQAIVFVSEIAPQLSEDVYLHILEAAPRILRIVHEALADYRVSASQAFTQSQDIAHAYLADSREFGEALRKLILNENTPFDEKKHWADREENRLREMRGDGGEDRNVY